jgi:hypothetical protein
MKDSKYNKNYKKIIPIISYENAEAQKEEALRENRNKTGIYK